MSILDSAVHRAVAFSLGSLLLSGAAYAAEGEIAAEPTAAPLSVEQQLLQRLEEQEQRIRILERRLELQDESAKAAAAAAPVIKASPGGFSIASDSKNNNQFKLRGLIHADGRYFLDNVNPTPAGETETFLLRRVRPTIEGTIGNIFDWRITPDFGGGRTVLQDAYIVGRFKPYFNVTAGKFKTPFGIERLQSASDMRFVERALPNGLVPNRDIGLQVGGDVLGGRVSYAVAFLNGVIDGGSAENNATADVDNNDAKELALRVFSQPFRESDSAALRGLGLGVAVTRANSRTQGTALAGQYRSPGQQTIFSYRAATAAAGANPATSATFADGERFRWSPQAYWYNGSFGALTEFVSVSQEVARTIGTTRRDDTLNHSGWQLQLGYFLTGEDSGYRVPAPRRPYARGAPGWGSFEVVARISELDFDNGSFTGGTASFADPATSVTKATAYGIGLNWYLTQSTKVVLNYELTQFDGGAAGGADRRDEKLLFSRVQVSF